MFQWVLFCVLCSLQWTTLHHLLQLQSRNKGEISPWGHTKPTFEEIERKLSIEIALQKKIESSINIFPLMYLQKTNLGCKN